MNVGGGFFLGSPNASDSSPGGNKRVNAQSIRPVTIHQLTRVADQSHPDAEFMLDGAELGQITLVAKVSSLNKGMTWVSYDISDHTGTISVRQWVEGSSEEEEGNTIEQDSYVRVMGTLKTFNGKRNINCMAIHLIKDFNELVYHDLEVIYVHLALTRGVPNNGQGGSTTGQNHGNQSNYGANPYAQTNGHGSSEAYSDLAPIQRKIMSYIASLGNSDQLPLDGIETTAIARGCPGQSIDTIRDQISFLVTEGHLYTTTDDDHVLPTS